MNHLIQFAVAMFATLSFAILFNAPRKEYFWCSITGASGWIAYLFLMQTHISPAIATIGATLILTILSRVLSVARRNPVTVFLIPGIFPLVPGAGIYYTSYYFIMNQRDLFFSKGVETISIAGAIALGIFLGFSMPQIWLQRVFGRR